MNHFSAREFALLCVPVALVAGAGLWVSMRPAPVPLHIDLRVEKPTTLEAFGGADAIWVTQIKGKDARSSDIAFTKTERVVEWQTPKGTQVVPTDSWTNSSPWRNVWKGPQKFDRLPINQMSIPAGELYFKFKTQPIYTNFKKGKASATPLPLLEGKWKIDRSQFAPFDFKAMPRAPLIRVRSVKVISASPGWVRGETSFDLLGAGMNAQTPVDFSFSGSVAFKDTTYLSGYDSNATVDPKIATRRVVRWDLNGPTPLPPKIFGDLHGRISADERWPLAFQVEPVDMSKVKSGQNLKFQQWPVPIPKP